ncbi:MAG: diguanylate cyclase [Nitrospirota bacterium]
MAQRILVVDDNAALRADLVRILKESDPSLEILEASDGVEALKHVAGSPVDLIITDLVMPRMDGLKLLAAIRQDDRFQHTPVIMVTSQNQIEEKLLTFDHGAQDFLTKPYHPAELVARTRVMLRLRAQMRSIEQQAIIDALTGLYNQNYLGGALTRELRRSQRHDLKLSCLMIDVDNFKAINDTYGHLAGDEVLRTVGRLLQTTLRGYDFAVRYGGDEFLVILAQNNPGGAGHVADRIREMVMHHTFFPQQSPPNSITVSIGVASLPGNAIRSTTAFIDLADQALYQAKKQGKNRVVVVEPSTPGK